MQESVPVEKVYNKVGYVKDQQVYYHLPADVN
jgi:hypothetical protein